MQFHAQTSAKYPFGVLDISKIGPMSFTPVAFITGDIFFGFLGQQRQAGCERGESHTSDGGSAPRALHACFCSPEKREENNACHAGHHSWATIEGGIYEKKTRLAHRQEGKAFPVKKNKTCFERNERDCVWSVIVVSVESLHSRIKI